MQDNKTTEQDLFEKDDLGRRVINNSDRDLLRSILHKDNARIEDEIDGVAGEVVLSLAYEGGGMEITRFRAQNGKTYFISSGSNMQLDENDDEEWVEWRDGPTASFEGSLAELRFGTNLLHLKPTLIHADYRDAVREHVRNLLTQVTAEERERVGDHLPKDSDEWMKWLRN